MNDQIETALRAMDRDNGYGVFRATHVLRVGDEYFTSDGAGWVSAGTDEKIVAELIIS